MRSAYVLKQLTELDINSLNAIEGWEWFTNDSWYATYKEVLKYLEENNN